MTIWMAGLAVVAGLAGNSGLAGDWKTPGGSIVRVERCGAAVCMTLVKVAPDVKVSTDAHNPAAGLRTRPLCGLRIGEGFTPDTETAASGGRLYDPQVGKTYTGKITLEGDRLKLRGYIGLSLFGRSEVWTRAGAVEACK